MKNTKLIHLLKQLSPEEFKNLRKFVYSPYFNSNKAIPKLYDFLMPFYPDFDSKKMNHEAAYPNIYEKSSANISKKIVDLMSEMYQLGVEYIRQLEFEKDEIGRQKYMADAFAERGYFKLFEGELNSLKEKIEKQPYRNIQYFQELYEIERKRYLRANIGQVEYSKSSLEIMKNSIEGIYDFGKLKVNLEMHSRKQLLAEEFNNIDEINEIGYFTENSAFQEMLIQKIYANLLKVVTEKDAEAFRKVKELFFENYEELTQDNQKDILGYLMNFTIIQWNYGNTSFIKDAFRILKFGFEEKLLINTPNIESLFINTVTQGAYLKEYDWLEKFLVNYSQYLGEDFRSSVIIFCEALIAFDKCKFSEARKILLSYNFVRLIDKLRAKSLLIRSIYEDFKLDESQYNLLNSQINAFRRYLKRNRKLSQKWRTSYFNFLKILNQIAKIKYYRKNTKYYIEKLLQDIDNFDSIYNKDWLKLKVSEMK